MSEEKDWRDVKCFYHVEGRCEVCGSKVKIGMEPRFLYKVCEEHSNLTPIEVAQQRKFKS